MKHFMHSHTDIINSGIIKDHEPQKVTCVDKPVGT